MNKATPVDKPISFLQPKKHKGFSLTELMIVIAIIGILSTGAIPMYQSYTRRARFSEIVQASAPYKLGVSLCYQKLGSLVNCNSGSQGIPPSITANSHSGLLNTLTVNKGIITATPKIQNGFNETDTYILTPKAQHHHLAWSQSGDAVKNGLAG